MALRTASTFPYTVTIDGESVRLRLKRLNVGEYERFAAMFQAMTQGRGHPAKTPDPDDAPPDLVQRRLAAEVAYLEANAAWVHEVFAAYVSVVEGDLEHDGQAVTDGGQFAAIYGGRQDMLGLVLAQLWLENTLTEDQKKTLALPRAFATGSSTVPLPPASGERPAPAVTDAAPPATAESDGVTWPAAGTWSGTTVPSS